jgi:hypothetical protein
MKEIKRLALRGVAWVSKGALLSLGLLTMLALVVVIGVLTAVMLMATVLPATGVRHERGPKGRRDSTNTSKFSGPREKAVVKRHPTGGTGCAPPLLRRKPGTPKQVLLTVCCPPPLHRVSPVEQRASFPNREEGAAK